MRNGQMDMFWLSARRECGKIRLDNHARHILRNRCCDVGSPIYRCLRNQLLAQVRNIDVVILVRNGQPLARVLPYHQENPEVSEGPTAFSIPHDGDAMSHEIAAYASQHKGLIKHYLNQYVAVYQGQVIDHDPDHSALFQRINTNYPEEIVLIRQVRLELPRPLHIRSPRLTQLP